MPTASELVPNRALSTPELRTLLTADFTRLLDNLSLLQSCTSFARVAWDIRIALHIDNAMQGTHTVEMASRPVAGNIIAGGKRGDDGRPMPPRPELAAVAAHPLADASPDAQIETRVLHRDVDSPNAERLRAGLAIPIERQQSDGTRVIENVQYPPDETLGEGAVAITDPDAIPESAREIKERIAREAQALEDERLAKLKAEEGQPPLLVEVDVGPFKFIDAAQKLQEDTERLTGVAPMGMPQSVAQTPDPTPATPRKGKKP